MYDAIVVGARCAGAPTAMLLARQGYRVLLVDRDTFPSDIMSTHYIHHPGIAQLKRWGLLDHVMASNCPPINQWDFEFGPFEWGQVALHGFPVPMADVTENYCPRRTVLDAILVEAAVAAGTELREAFSVQDMVMDGDCAVGIRGRSRGGATVTERGRIVIGADGLHSTVARAVQAPTYEEKPALDCYYYSYWSGLPSPGVELYQLDRRFILLNPTNDALTCVLAGRPSDEFHAFRSDIEGNFLRTLDLVPEVAERVRQGKREERFVGTADLPNFFRKPFGPGWALVGDAGYHKTPYGGVGITDAFRDAELLAEAIHAGFSDQQSLEAALTGYEQRRNEAALPLYQLLCDLATMEPPRSDMQQLFAALSENQHETNRFFGTIAGTVSIAEFFAQENIERIINATS